MATFGLMPLGLALTGPIVARVGQHPVLVAAIVEPRRADPGRRSGSRGCATSATPAWSRVCADRCRGGGYFGFCAYCEAIGPDCPTYLEFRSTWP